MQQKCGHEACRVTAAEMRFLRSFGGGPKTDRIGDEKSSEFKVKHMHML
jgi:hypothetical protein